MPMSPSRNRRYTNNDQKQIFAIALNCAMRTGRLHAFAIHNSMRMIRAVPAAMEETKNKTGSNGDHHWPASSWGINRNNEPNELWCIVESVTAAMASIIGSAFLSRSRKIQARKENKAAASAV